MAFKVFKGAVMPEDDGKNKYNFEDLTEAGEMLFVPYDPSVDGTDKEFKNRVQAAATSWGKRREITLTARICKAEGQLGVGVWRMN